MSGDHQKTPMFEFMVDLDRYTQNMNTNHMARVNYFLMALPLPTLLGLAPIFLGEGFFLVADFFATEAFFTGTLTLPAL